MKRLVILIAIVIISNSFLLNVSAAGTSPGVSDKHLYPDMESDGQDGGMEEVPEPIRNPEPVIISLESEAVYPGMDKSYSSGYIPKVKKGYVEVVLPLTAEGDIDGEITVSTDLGDPATSPFVMANYEKKVSRHRHNKRRVYLASFEFELKEDPINGVYPVVFTAGAKDDNGSYYEKVFTLYVTITDGVSPDGAGIVIDSQNKYVGMAASYASGYVPEVAGDRATVFLPLLVEGSIEGGLKITPQIGDTSGQAFIMSNFEKYVTGDYYYAGGKLVFAYLARFEFPLKKDRVNGVYPITFLVSATGKNGKAVQRDFTVHVTIDDGTDPGAGKSVPKIIAGGMVTQPETIVAGCEFTGTITLKNTSSKEAVQNITVAVTSSDRSITLADSTNTFFFKGLGCGKTLKFPLQLAAGRDTQPGRYDLVLDISYEDEKAAAHSASVVVSVDVRQQASVVLEMPRLEEDIYAGDTLPLTFKMINMGRSPVYNVRCVMKAPGLFPDGTAYIGTMEAGTEGNAEMNVFIGSKDMDDDYTGTEKYGFTEGQVTLIYEDETGKEYTTDYDFATVINAPLDPVQQEEEPEMAGQWWASLLIGGVVVLGGIAYLYLRYGKRGVNHGA